MRELSDRVTLQHEFAQRFFEEFREFQTAMSGR